MLILRKVEYDQNKSDDAEDILKLGKSIINQNRDDDETIE